MRRGVFAGAVVASIFSMACSEIVVASDEVPETVAEQVDAPEGIAQLALLPDPHILATDTISLTVHRVEDNNLGDEVYRRGGLATAYYVAQTESFSIGEYIAHAELIRDGDLAAVGDVPEGLARAARGEPVSLGAYLDLDDSQLLASVARWARSSDPFLAEHAARLLERRLPKTLPLPDDEAVWEEVQRRARGVADAAGGRAELTVYVDVAKDVPYPEPATGAGGLWIQIRHQPMRRLGEVSFLLGELRNKRIRRPRLIFPAPLRAAVVDAVRDLLTDDEPTLVAPSS